MTFRTKSWQSIMFYTFIPRLKCGKLNVLNFCISLKFLYYAHDIFQISTMQRGPVVKYLGKIALESNRIKPRDNWPSLHLTAFQKHVSIFWTDFNTWLLCYFTIKPFKSSFQISNSASALVLHFCVLWSAKKSLINQSEVKPKAIVTYSHAFSRAWCRFHVFALSSDWFIGLSESVFIHKSNYFSFGLRIDSIEKCSRIPFLSGFKIEYASRGVDCWFLK